MRALSLVLAVFCFISSMDGAWASDQRLVHKDEAIRINRPASKDAHAVSKKTSQCCQDESCRAEAAGVSSNSLRRQTELDVAATPGTEEGGKDRSNFRGTIGPYQHFQIWLHLNLHPPLCPFVLCQRQCALTEAPCHALGFDKGILEEHAELNDGCSSSCH